MQRHNIGFSVGANFPMYKGFYGETVLSLQYEQFYFSGLGFRTGLQWTPTMLDVDHAVGVPVALAYRFNERNARQRFTSGLHGAASVLKNDGGYVPPAETFGSMLVGFLASTYSHLEFFAGATPGYVFGTPASVGQRIGGFGVQKWETYWTEKKTSFALSLDAGMSLIFKIWRFDLKVTPTFHYQLTDNYIYLSTSGVGDTPERTTTLPVRWFFTISGGLAFRF